MHSPSRWRAVARALSLELIDFGNLLLLWQARWLQRARLDRLSDHMLKDLGISRADVSREVRKPFWRD
ncbi:MAG TPA: DUF1127 domain-containing protein [Dongiaceae bacterium]|nr:DUF1127 domain-containing protein [Dongiaceae bacterium]